MNPEVCIWLDGHHLTTLEMHEVHEGDLIEVEGLAVKLRVVHLTHMYKKDGQFIGRVANCEKVKKET